jgi:hypothetical protein
MITLLFVGLLLMAGMAFVGQMLLADRTKVGQRVDRMMQGRVEKVVRTTAAANRSQRWLFSLGAGTVPPREERELLRRLGTLDVPAELAGPVFDCCSVSCSWQAWLSQPTEWAMPCHWRCVWRLVACSAPLRVGSCPSTY